MSAGALISEVPVLAQRIKKHNYKLQDHAQQVVELHTMD